MRLDLHVHTSASDGVYESSKVVSIAGGTDLDVIAITDHDTVAGVPQAIEVAAAEQRIHVIPGIEISSILEGGEYHILGYFVDPDTQSIKAHEIKAGEGRKHRMLEMMDRLLLQGIIVEYEDVLYEAGSEFSTIGRPHLARALVTKGYASSTSDAFSRLIGNGHPAYVPTQLSTPSEAIGIILNAGGIPIWAHPPAGSWINLLPHLIEEGLQGLEVYRPRSRPNHIFDLQLAAKDSDLLMTGGSDWHGPNDGLDLGDFFVTEEEVGKFLQAGGM
jgi:predicted metal-dependent phosphoesterase TrpH